MIPAARIQAVIELLANIIEEPRPADGTVSAYFRDRRFIGSKDRAAINVRTYRIIRAYHRLGWWIKRNGMEVNERTLVIADLMFEREHSFASLPDTFSGERFTPDLLSEDELKLARALKCSADYLIREDADIPGIIAQERAEPGKFRQVAQAGSLFAQKFLNPASVSNYTALLLARFSEMR